MKQVEALTFTDEEVENICREYDENAEPEYSGGNVFVNLMPENSRTIMWMPFAEILAKVRPELHVDPRAIAIYDFGNVIFNSKEIACVVMNV